MKNNDMVAGGSVLKSCKITSANVNLSIKMNFKDTLTCFYFWTSLYKIYTKLTLKKLNVFSSVIFNDSSALPPAAVLLFSFLVQYSVTFLS